jgi:hypothetical protein
MARNDPQFEEKAADIIALSMNPPQRSDARSSGIEERHYAFRVTTTRPSVGLLTCGSG